jgi:uncharacterized protein
MEIEVAVLLFGAGILGGVINAVAGGATFFTFPAMLAAGLPPVVANASNALAVAPGHLLATIALRRDLPPLRGGLTGATVIGLCGGIAGALLLLGAGERTFLILVPFLILGATLLFMVAPKLQNWIAPPEGRSGPRDRLKAAAVHTSAAIYGGYFGAGLGIMMLAALTLIGYRDLRQANAVKNYLAALITGIAIVVFAGFGAISWPETLVMLCGAIVGGYLGGHLAKILPVKIVRACVIVTGLTLSAVYFNKLFAG